MSDRNLTYAEIMQEPERYPGDWMPYGRAPYEFIPEVDYGPVGGMIFPKPGRGDVGGERLKRWHKLRKAGPR